MIKDNKESFLTWLKGRVSPSQLLQFNTSYKVIDEFCIKNNIIKQSILKTTDETEINLVQDTIIHNRIFKSQNKKSLQNIDCAMKYYIKYTKEMIKIESIEENEDIQDVNFFDICDLSYTKPIYVTYFGIRIDEASSWRQLYFSIFKKLFEDYEEKIPLNKSFNGENRRMDFCSSYYYTSMMSPMKVCKDRYLETNLSATNMVRKLKSLLDYCFIDYKNLIIKYKKKIEDKDVSKKIKSQVVNSSESESFYNWLSVEQGLAKPTCRNYVSAINTAQSYAEKNGFAHHILYTNDYNEAFLTANELFNSKEFNIYNKRQHNRFKSSINKLLLYIENLSNKVENNKNTINLEPFKEILIEKFSKGFRVSSLLDLRKFKHFWEMKYNEVLDIDDKTILKCIKQCGIIHEEKLYLPQIMLNNETKEKLLLYIKNNFSSGKNIIYFESLFNKFSNDFLDYAIYNPSMLRSYLIYINKNHEYYIDKDFISKCSSSLISPDDEVKNYLIQRSAPVENERLFKDLSHIPKQKIRNILIKSDEFINNAKNQYFHISIAMISEEELENISTIINNEINEHDFISGNELINYIRKKYYYIIEKNSMISDIGLRGIIAYKLNDRFSFKGNIISQKGKNLSMMEVFSNFCQEKEKFTLEDLRILKKELNTNIYFEAVYKNSIRVSKNKFVSKESITFIPNDIDKAIDRFCTNDYIPFNRISYFGSFPESEYKWNSFLLENYVAMYSINYKLIHSNYNEDSCVGAIVKKSSKINSMDDLIIDVLANNNLPLEKDESLNYLYEEGYLGRRSYSNIKQLLIKAKELRNKKGL